MATYFTAPAHERLNIFFGELFREMRKALPQTHGQFLLRAEQEFQRLGYREKISAGVENILVVRFDAIGDMILMSGFLRELRRNFPQARITLVAHSDVCPVVEFCPYVNEVLGFDRKIFRKDLVDIMEQIAIFCREHLWQKKISIAFLPRWHNDTLGNLLMAWLSGARERIGYGTYPFHSWKGAPSPQIAAIDNFLLTQNVVTPRSVVSDVEKNFYLLQTCGHVVEQDHMELFYGAADIQRADELLATLPADCKKVVVCVGSREGGKKYPPEKYLIAFRELLKKNLVFVIVGGRDDIDAATYLEKNLPSGKVLNLAGKTTIRETEAIVSRMDYYVGNDTSIMHMAAAEQIPVLALFRDPVDKEDVLPAIFGPFRRFFPWQTKSVVLRPDHAIDECATLPPVYGYCRRNYPHCIAQIPPQEIIEGFERLQSL